MSLSSNNGHPNRIGLLCSLAWRDLLYDRKVALCIVFSLVSVIAPLLLLFGLKNGIVTQLHSQLLNDPRNLEIRMLGNGNYPQSWFDDIAQKDDVRFVIPLTRSLNTQADIVIDSQHFIDNAEMIPTANNDPLLDGVTIPKNADTLVLSASAAQKLQANVGDNVRLFISRKLNGINERAKRTLTVGAIISDSKFARAAAFVSLDVLVAMEDYRDGYQAPLFGVTEGEKAKTRTQFAKARLYATDLEAIAPLDQWFQQQHIDVLTQKSQIESVKAISYVLNVIFSVIAWVSLLGCVASLIGAFLANIDRKRKDMAVLRLLGFRQFAVSLYIVFQALLLTIFAFMLALMLYGIGSTLFTTLLGTHLPDQSFVCQLTLGDLFIAMCSALLVALVVAGIGALRAVSIEPAESLREI